MEYSIVLNNIGVFIFFTVLIIILALFIPKECNIASEDGECKRRPCNRLLKRDFKYCVAILILCIIFIATFVMGKEENILSYISFASTVTSIILSVLAIMMTLFAESKSDETKTKMSNFLEKIEKISKDTEAQVKKIEDVSEELNKRYPIYETITKQQNKMLEKQDEVINVVNRGMLARSYENESNLWMRLENKKEGTEDGEE